MAHTPTPIDPGHESSEIADSLVVDMGPLLDGESLEQLSSWLDERLTELEEQFRRFWTPQSIGLSLKRS